MAAFIGQHSHIYAENLIPYFYDYARENSKKLFNEEENWRLLTDIESEMSATDIRIAMFKKNKRNFTARIDKFIDALYREILDEQSLNFDPQTIALKQYLAIVAPEAEKNIENIIRQYFAYAKQHSRSLLSASQIPQLISRAHKEQSLSENLCDIDIALHKASQEMKVVVEERKVVEKQKEEQKKVVREMITMSWKESVSKLDWKKITKEKMEKTAEKI